ncbi:MAG: hypothetical protein M1354_02870 [Candidatus Marsarchaeota archaeon]|nr:hypothetical protein [Candidatus Marsarchaeota archaeon]
MRLGQGMRLLLPLALVLGVLGAAPAASAASVSNPIGYTPSSCTGTGGTTAVNGPNPAATIGLTLIALSLAFDVVALGYLFSKIMPALNPVQTGFGFAPAGISGWVRNELYELTKSALLVVSIYAVIVMVSGISLVLSPVPLNGGSSGSFAGIGNLITESESYLCTADGNLVYGWKFIGEESVAIGLLQGSQIGLWVPLPFFLPPYIEPDEPPSFAITSGFAIKPYQNFMLESGNLVIQHFESAVFDLVQFVLFPVTAMISGLIPLLPFLVSLGLTVLIPVGLVFRAFPFIRGIGGTLIAIGVAVSLIFPSMLVLLDAPVSNWANQLMPTAYEPASNCNGGFFCTAFKAITNVAFSTHNFAKIPEYAWEAFFGIYTFYNGFMGSAFYSIVQLLLFAVNLIIMFQLTDGLARALGGSIRLSLGSKLKLG